MQTINIHFCYKGERNYVHGSDMYETVVGLIRTAWPEATTGIFQMMIHDIVRCQCQFLYSEKDNETHRPENSKVQFRFALDTTKVTGWLVETQKPIIERVQYLEQEIVEKCSIKDKAVFIADETPYSAIEVLLAITKHLHHVLYPQADGNWFFVRLDLDRLLYPNDATCFQVELVQNLQNRLTKLRILPGNKVIGHIYFSLVKCCNKK